MLAANGVLTRDEAQALVERAVKLSKADADQRVACSSGRETNVRFADNQMSTAGATTDAQRRASQSVLRHEARASVTTNDLIDEALARAVQQSEALARLAPDDPGDHAGARRRSSTRRCHAWFDVDGRR